MRRTDERGRQVLARWSPFVLIAAAMQGGVPGITVPEAFIDRNADDAGVVVRCPCGHKPELPELTIIQCECQRAYFNGIKEIWSLNAPVKRESA